MRWSDCLRLGGAGIIAHKRRSLLIAIIIGLLFALIVAGFELIQGLENAALAETTRITAGRVLLKVAVAPDRCKEDCDTNSLVAQLSKDIIGAGGRAEVVEAYDISFSRFYVVPHGLPLAINPTVYALARPGDALALLPTEEAGSWQKLNIQDLKDAPRIISIAETIRSRSIGQVLENHSFGSRPGASNSRFFILDLLPSALTGVSLSLGNVNDPSNALNILLDVIPSARSDNFILFAPTGEAELVDTSGSLWAVFPDLRSAERFAASPLICDINRQSERACTSGYRFLVEEPIGSPLHTIAAFQNVWDVYHVIWFVLMLITMVIMMSTYSRLILQESGNIALYRATGASRLDVMKIYTIHLVLTSVIGIVVALAIGTMLTLIVNALCATDISATFAVSYGINPPDITLLGWNSDLLIPLVAMIIICPLCVLINIRRFSADNLARKAR